MKHLFSTALLLLLSIHCFSQRGYTKTTFIDTFDEKLAERVANANQRDYNNSRIVSCKYLISLVESKALINDVANINRSSFVLGATFHNVDAIGYVVMKLKVEEGYYKRYVFCDVRYDWWLAFKEEGEANSWGEAYHKYIEPNKCKCN